MKKILKYCNNKTLKGTLIITSAILFLLLPKSICFADATGKVTAPTAKIRESADINSEVIASSSNGQTVTITAQVTDAAGTVWYEVYVDANTKGYIRSDLVQKDASSGDIPSKTAQSTTTSAATGATATETTPAATASGAEIPAETEMSPQYATVIVPAAKIRSSASTTSGIVDTVAQNTQLIVSGQTNGSDGRTWYYVTFTGSGGQEKTGYVRNDLIELGEAASVEEPQTDSPEGIEGQYEPEEVLENKDYEVVYEDTEEGGVWYLYNNLEGRKQKLEDLIEAANAQELNESIDSSTITKQRIAIIIMIAVIFFMAVVMTIMLFKLRDAYYEAYEDEEEDEEVKINERTRNNKRNNVETKKSTIHEQKQPQVKKRPSEYDKRIPVKEVTYEEEPATQIKPAPKKKAKNFMIDDEDFEFEFLKNKNIDV